ncbi:hypothetical protein ZWY2020_042469 [Hordeum vulgare]|nr:hypothetical protein ZWY2020_042469 [Hordeum vulgare]
MPKHIKNLENIHLHVEDALDTPSTEHVETASPTTFIFINRSNTLTEDAYAIDKIKDNITQEYRVHEPRDLDHGTIQKPNPKPTSATARKSKPAFNPDDMMDVFMNMCIDYMNRQARQIPDQVAEKVLEKLNKEGVMYKPAAVVPSCKNDGHDEVDSFENAMFSENVAPEVVANELMPELIGVDVTFVEIDCRCGGGHGGGHRVLLLLCWAQRRRSNGKGRHGSSRLAVMRQLSGATTSSGVPVYSYNEVAHATNSFSDTHRLGTGAYGSAGMTLLATGADPVLHCRSTRSVSCKCHLMCILHTYIFHLSGL